MNIVLENSDFEEQIRTLIHRLMDSSIVRPDPKKLLKEISSRPSSILPPRGERSRHVIFQNSQFEIVLMHWGVNSSSPIHGHGGSQCYMQILSGELIETRYRPYCSIALCENKLISGKVTHINDEASFHKLSSNVGATSLHLYASPLHSMQIFDEQQREWIDKTVSEVS